MRQHCKRLYSAGVIYALATLCECVLAMPDSLFWKRGRGGLLFIPSSLSWSSSSHGSPPEPALWVHSASAAGFYCDWVGCLLGMMQRRRSLSRGQTDSSIFSSFTCILAQTRHKHTENTPASAHSWRYTHVALGLFWHMQSLLRQKRISHFISHELRMSKCFLLLWQH